MVDEPKIKIIPVERWGMAKYRNDALLKIVLRLDFDAAALQGRELYFHISQQNARGMLESLKLHLGEGVPYSDKPLN